MRFKKDVNVFQVIRRQNFITSLIGASAKLVVVNSNTIAGSTFEKWMAIAWCLALR